MSANSDTIVVNASGTAAGGVGAQFNLVVDGVTIGSGTTGTSVGAFSFNTTLTASQAHDVQVVFTNDATINGQDRNLSLQSIVVDGKTIQATSNLEVYRTIYGQAYAGTGMMSWNGAADFTLAAGFLPTPVAAYYVAVNGNDTTGNGTLAKPFATLNRAQAAMETSSIRTTYVEGGVYNLKQSINLTSADNGMSFLSAPGQHAVLNGGPSALANLMWLNGTQNVTIQGLTFENTATGYFNGALALTNATGTHIVGNLFTNNDRGVLMTSSSSNVISGNEMDNSVTAGINAGASSNYNTIDSNLINGTSYTSGTGTGSAGIMITGGSYNAISHNLVENTAGVGIGLYNWNTDADNRNIGNTISNNSVVKADSSAFSNDSGGIYIDGRAGVDTKTLVTNNSVNLATSPTVGNDVGIYVDDWTSGATITNNIVTGGNFGFLIHGGQNNTISNNVFDLGTRTSSNVGAGLIQSDPGGPISMANNLVTHNILYSTATSASNAFVNYGGTGTILDNLYYNTNGQSIGLSANTPDANAQYGNPNFVNAAAGNYTTGTGSAASAIGFQNINQSTMGLAPSTVHWY